MKIVRIERMPTPWATLGKVTLLGETIQELWSLELPWKDNARNVSCIPRGFYTCTKYSSPRYNSTYRVNDVPNRDYILFHKGNSAADTEGCILLGKARVISDNKIKVLDSASAFNQFMAFIDGDESFELQIIPYLPEYP